MKCWYIFFINQLLFLLFILSSFHLTFDGWYVLFYIFSWSELIFLKLYRNNIINYKSSSQLHFQPFKYSLGNIFFPNVFLSSLFFTLVNFTLASIHFFLRKNYWWKLCGMSPPKKVFQDPPMEYIIYWSWGSGWNPTTDRNNFFLFVIISKPHTFFVDEYML